MKYEIPLRWKRLGNKRTRHKNANTKLDCERGGGEDLSALWLKLHAEIAWEQKPWPVSYCTFDLDDEV